MLNLKNVTKEFGGITALYNISFSVDEGEFIGLIGPNGSGKTTLFNVISGALKANKGSIIFENENITDKDAAVICHKGIARTFQVPRPFPSLNVFDNVMTSYIYGSKNNQFKQKEAEDEVQKLIEFVGLAEKQYNAISELNVIDMRRLELSRALATKPKLLLADEILSGLTHSELSQAVSVLEKIWKEMSITVIWVEHILGALAGTVKRAIVLNYGEIIADGPPGEIMENKAVIDAYIGEE